MVAKIKPSPTDFAVKLMRHATGVSSNMIQRDCEEAANELYRLEHIESDMKRQIAASALLLDGARRAKSVLAQIKNRGEWLYTGDFDFLDAAIAQYEALTPPDQTNITHEALEVVRMIASDIGYAHISKSVTDRVAARIERYADGCLAAVEQERDELRKTADDLAMLIKQLVHSLRKAAPSNETAARAMDYLQRKELTGSPLREANAAMRKGE